MELGAGLSAVAFTGRGRAAQEGRQRRIHADRPTSDRVELIGLTSGEQWAVQGARSGIGEPQEARGARLGRVGECVRLSVV